MAPIPEDDEHIQPSDTPTKASDAKEKRHMSLRGRWKLTSTVNKMIAIATIVSAASTLTYAVFTYLQWRVLSEQIAEIKKGSNDTHTLATAADTQSKQAIEQTKKMGESITKTDKLIGATSDLAKEAKRSADIANEGVKLTRKALRLDQRAWVGPLAVNKISIKPGVENELEIVITNTGKTPALNMESHVMLHFMPASKPMTFGYLPPKERVVDTLYPHGQITLMTSKFILTIPQMEYLKMSESILYTYGKITYKDIFGESHLTTFCFKVETTLESAISCEVYNAAN